MTDVPHRAPHGAATTDTSEGHPALRERKPPQFAGY